MRGLRRKGASGPHLPGADTILIHPEEHDFKGLEFVALPISQRLFYRYALSTASRCPSSRARSER